MSFADTRGRIHRKQRVETKTWSSEEWPSLRTWERKAGLSVPRRDEALTWGEEKTMWTHPARLRPVADRGKGEDGRREGTTGVGSFGTRGENHEKRKTMCEQKRD